MTAYPAKYIFVDALSLRQVQTLHIYNEKEEKRVESFKEHHQKDTGHPPLVARFSAGTVEVG
jgi:hypothetical protein